VARALAGAWRLLSSPPDLSAAELQAIAPLLHRSGVAGLVFWRLRGSDLQETPPAAGFRQAYRLYTLEAAIHRQRIQRVLEALGTAGVEPILAKGWAMARLYPEEGLRPYGDLDLYIRPREFPVAAEQLARLADVGCPVDLHAGFARLGESFEALQARSRLVPLGGLQVRVLDPEDHLRLLCHHMLGHGAWRPLWLCDLAVAVEAGPGGGDWDRLLAGRARSREWVACALALAGELLGGRLEELPAAVREKRLPRWLLPSVLAAWGEVSPQTPQGVRRPMSDYLLRPAGLLRAIRARWPNPIEATVGVGGPFNELPRLPFQIGECLSRAARFAWGLPRLLRARL
jgi:hypothetical protein